MLFWGEVALWVWATVDCVTRKAAAFPAVDKLSKGAWLGITATSLALGLLASGFWTQVPDPAAPFFALISTVACGVYLADVRPAVRESSGGSRW